MFLQDLDKRLSSETKRLTLRRFYTSDQFVSDSWMLIMRYKDALMLQLLTADLTAVTLA